MDWLASIIGTAGNIAGSAIDARSGRTAAQSNERIAALNARLGLQSGSLSATMQESRLQAQQNMLVFGAIAAAIILLIVFTLRK